jgi:hypothetical protein
MTPTTAHSLGHAERQLRLDGGIYLVGLVLSPLLIPAAVVFAVVLGVLWVLWKLGVIDVDD